MERVTINRISLNQAMALSIVVQVIYLPVSIYINVEPENLMSTIGFFALPGVVGFVFHTLFILVADRFAETLEVPSVERFLVKSAMPAFILSIPVALLATMFSNHLFKFVYASMKSSLLHLGYSVTRLSVQDQSALVHRVNSGVTFLVMLSICYLIINRRETLKNRGLEVKAQRLINESTLAQLEALRNQISPHFLFNSLSILSSLIHKNVELAGQFIIKLSNAYRYVLEHKNDNLIPLTTELTFIKSYGFLLDIRFADKLRLRIDIPDDVAKSYKVAPLTLQLLIENAVKHNKLSEEMPLMVLVTIRGDYLIVENDKRLRDKNNFTKSMNLGLENIQTRYTLLTSKPIFLLEDTNKFIVKIPLLP